MTDFIKNHFGSNRGLFNYIKYRCQLLTGAYSNALNPDFSKVSRFVFVCSGNICRSALAECVMKKSGGNSISFGLDTRGDDPADPRMIAFAKSHKYDLSEHRTTPVDQYVPHDHDLLIGMEPRHFKQLCTMFPTNPVTLLGLWLKQKNLYLHDPYSADMIYFNRCGENILTATKNLFRKFAKKTSPQI